MIYLSSFIRKARINEIRCYKVGVESVEFGQTCSLSITPLSHKDIKQFFKDIRIRSLLIDSSEVPELFMSFIAEITVLNKENDVKVGLSYEPLVVSATFKQPCSIEILNNTVKPSKETIYKTQSKEKLSKNRQFMKTRAESECLINLDKSLYEAKDLNFMIFECNRKIKVRFKFKFKAQFIVLNQRILIDDIKMKATGIILKAEHLSDK